MGQNSKEINIFNVALYVGETRVTVNIGNTLIL